jgi:hypothetical protein
MTTAMRTRAAAPAAAREHLPVLGVGGCDGAGTRRDRVFGEVREPVR